MPVESGRTKQLWGQIKYYKFTKTLQKLKKEEEERLKNANPKVKKYKDGGCDLMFIIGTALAVTPFALSVHKAKNGCPKVLINLENTDYNGFDF